jgi:hypothetical protein
LHGLSFNGRGVRYVEGLVGGRAFGGEELRKAEEVRDEERAIRRGIERPVQGERREDVAAVERYRSAADAGDRLLVTREGTARQSAQRHHNLWVNRRELGEQVRSAGVDLCRLRGAPLGRVALDQRGKVTLLALEPDRRQEPVEQHPRRAPKGLTLPVLVKARRLAHDKELGV